MQVSKIETQYGHLDIAQRSYWDNASVDQITDKMVDNPNELIKKISLLPEVNFVSSRISFYGLVNTEVKSIPAQFVGFDPQIETHMQEHLLLTEGAAFSNPKSAIVGTGLAQLLKVKSGDDVTIVSPTLQGGINAMDLHISGIFSTGWTDIDNKTVFLSLADAQKVLDTQHVDQVLINLKNSNDIPKMFAQLTSLLPSPDLQVKRWTDLADIYTQVENFYNFQNIVIETILLALLILSVSNTTYMIIFERLGEIGTLRALGDYETDIQKLFFLEATFLGLLSIAIGIPISFFIMKAISNSGVPLTLPFSSRPIPLKMIPLLSAYLEASFICIFSIVAATIWPAKKGSYTSVVTALRAKI